MKTKTTNENIVEKQKNKFQMDREFHKRMVKLQDKTLRTPERVKIQNIGEFEKYTWDLLDREFNDEQLEILNEVFDYYSMIWDGWLKEEIDKYRSLSDNKKEKSKYLTVVRRNYKKRMKNI